MSAASIGLALTLLVLAAIVVCWATRVDVVPRDPADPREQELVQHFKATTLAHPELTAVEVAVNGAVGILVVSSTLAPWLSERWVYHHLAGGWRLIRIAH